jgi:hypothetical protein
LGSTPHPKSNIDWDDIARSHLFEIFGSGIPHHDLFIFATLNWDSPQIAGPPDSSQSSRLQITIYGTLRRVVSMVERATIVK